MKQDLLPTLSMHIFFNYLLSKLSHMLSHDVVSRLSFCMLFHVQTIEHYSVIQLKADGSKHPKASALHSQSPPCLTSATRETPMFLLRAQESTVYVFYLPNKFFL